MARRGRVLWRFFVPLGGACPPSGARSRIRPLECAIHHHVTSTQQPTAIKTSSSSNNNNSNNPEQTPRPAAAQPSTRTDTQTGKGAVVLDRQPARPLCLVSCRAPATCRRRHVTETEPTTPRASHPVRTLHQTAPGDRRTSSFVCGIEKCHVGDRDRLFGSSFSTSTGHRKRNPRAALRNARALPSGASLSARETASEGAGRSQLTESGKHCLTPPPTRPPKPLRSQFRNF